MMAPGTARLLQAANLGACAAGLIGSALSEPVISSAASTQYGLPLWFGWLAACGAGSLAAVVAGSKPAFRRIVVPLHYFAAFGYMFTAGMAGAPAGGGLWWASGLVLLATAVPYGWPLGRWVLAPTLLGLLAIAGGWRAMLPPLVPTGPPSAEKMAVIRETIAATMTSMLPTEGISGSFRRQLIDQLTATSTPYPTVVAGHRLEGPNVQRRPIPDSRQLRWVVAQDTPGPRGCTHSGGNSLGTFLGMSVVHYEVEYDPDTCRSLFVIIERPPNPNVPTMSPSGIGAGAGTSYMGRGTPIPRLTAVAVSEPAP
ncbi:MAG: hypothetical protein EXR52_08645 [Dehalococcoidia bacterium]|nr:hypothetical protein [Dehalococcoidia bacterium]